MHRCLKELYVQPVRQAWSWRREAVRAQGLAQADCDMCWPVGKHDFASLTADTNKGSLERNAGKLTPDACVEGSAVAYCRRQGFAALQGLGHEAGCAAMAFKCAMLACLISKHLHILRCCFLASCAASTSGLELVSESGLLAQLVAAEKAA